MNIYLFFKAHDFLCVKLEAFCMPMYFINWQILYTEDFGWL